MVNFLLLIVIRYAVINSYLLLFAVLQLITTNNYK